MIVDFKVLIEDSKKENITYKLYLPENFRGYADSQTKAIIDILKVQIKGLNESFLIPPTAFDSNLKKSNFSKLERQIISYSTYSEVDSSTESAENLTIFEEKKDLIIIYLTKSYTNYYSKIKN